MPDLLRLIDDLQQPAIQLFLLVSGVGFIAFGALAFRKAADAPRGWDRALRAFHALAHVGLGFVVLWALWTTST